MSSLEANELTEISRSIRKMAAKAIFLDDEGKGTALQVIHGLTDRAERTLTRWSRTSRVQKLES